MKTKLAIVTALASIFTAGTASAMIIDDFSVTQGQIYLTGPAPATSLGNLQLGPVANIVGGSRQTDVTMYDGDDAADVNVRVVAGVLDVNDSVSAATEVMLTWDANGLGLGNLDLFAGGLPASSWPFPPRWIMPSC